MLLAVMGCSGIPEAKHVKYSFPKDGVIVGDTKRPYEKLGVVRTKVNFVSIDPADDDSIRCRNYYNKAAKDLLKKAREQHADAVIKLRSVVFYEGGSHETFETPECSDDGQEGQILIEGIAVKWKPEPAASAAPAAAPAPAAEQPPGANEL